MIGSRGRSPAAGGNHWKKHGQRSCCLRFNMGHMTPIAFLQVGLLPGDGHPRSEPVSLAFWNSLSLQAQPTRFSPHSLVRLLLTGGMRGLRESGALILGDTALVTLGRLMASFILPYFLYSLTKISISDNSKRIKSSTRPLPPVEFDNGTAVRITYSHTYCFVTRGRSRVLR